MESGVAHELDAVSRHAAPEALVQRLRRRPRGAERADHTALRVGGLRQKLDPPAEEGFVLVAGGVGQHGGGATDGLAAGMDVVAAEVGAVARARGEDERPEEALPRRLAPRCQRGLRCDRTTGSGPWGSLRQGRGCEGLGRGGLT